MWPWIVVPSHGVIARRQALALGFTARMIERRITAGRWQRVHPGVSVIAGTGPDPRRALMAGCLSLGDRSVASHRSAAWLWQLSGFAEVAPSPEFLVPLAVSTTPRELLVHRTDRLERLVLNALRRHRIPAPVRGHPVLLPSGRTIYLDHSWPDHAVVLEVLGRRWHSGRKRWVRDVTRGNEATSVGWRVMTATQEHLDDGGRALAADLRRLLELTRPRR
jgi:hypothetical protein